ncbi:hypothetical protein D3C81_1433930 [compost metagenome]
MARSGPMFTKVVGNHHVDCTAGPAAHGHGYVEQPQAFIRCQCNHRIAQLADVSLGALLGRTPSRQYLFSTPFAGFRVEAGGTHLHIGCAFARAGKPGCHQTTVRQGCYGRGVHEVHQPGRGETAGINGPGHLVGHSLHWIHRKGRMRVGRIE